MTAAVVDEYQARSEQLAASTAASMLSLYVALQAGGLPAGQAVAAMAAVVNMANAAATTLADVFAAAQIEAASGIPTPPTGIAPSDDEARLTRAIGSILDDLPDDEIDDVEPELDDGEIDDGPPAPEPTVDAEAALDQLDDIPPEPAVDAQPDPAEVAGSRLERLARSEPLETGHAVTVEIINRIPRAAGWSRVLDADPCERCLRWAEDGRVFPKDAHFKRHLNCNCQQQIVTTTEGTPA